LGGRGRQMSEFKASLVYKVSSRTARATQRNPVSKKPKNQNKKKKRPKKKKKKKKKEKKNTSQQKEAGTDMLFLSRHVNVQCYL
jgi:hypothetical protein